jgi:hypothetical protein
MLSESTLDVIVERSGLDRPGAASSDRTKSIATGCGANALYIALCMLGRPQPFSEILEALDIRESRRDCSFAAIVETARKSGVEAMAVLGDEMCLRTPAGVPVILHTSETHSDAEIGAEITSGGSDHFYLVDDYDPGTDTVRVFDPPGLANRAKVDSLLQTFTGNAILFGEQAVSAFQERLRRDHLVRVAFVAGGAAVLFLAFGLWRRRRR